MMPRKVLLQFDCDPGPGSSGSISSGPGSLGPISSGPSAFDAIVAVDAGVDVLLPYGGVTAESVVPLVHGAMFTRGGDDLRRTAIFIGGSDVKRAEAVRDAVLGTFFGPVRVGVMLDPSGANTTAAAAVIAASRHVPLAGAAAVVLGGTGPVGQRVARLLARKGASVGIASRSAVRAAEVRDATLAAVPEARVRPLVGAEIAAALADADVVIAAGAPGVRLASREDVRPTAPGVGRALRRDRVLVDLNAVPPAGIEGVGPSDKAVRQTGLEGDVIVYGALGVGGTKMKIHRRAIARLFESEAVLLDAEELLAIGESLEG